MRKNKDLGQPSLPLSLLSAQAFSPCFLRLSMLAFRTFPLEDQNTCSVTGRHLCLYQA